MLRLEKRLSCAAAGLGYALNLEIRKDAEVLGIPFGQTPAVLQNGTIVLHGVPRTEEIEAWFRARANRHAEMQKSMLPAARCGSAAGGL